MYNNHPSRRHSKRLTDFLPPGARAEAALLLRMVLTSLILHCTTLPANFVATRVLAQVSAAQPGQQ
jgi:hypothetical protein